MRSATAEIDLIIGCDCVPRVELTAEAVGLYVTVKCDTVNHC